MFFFFFQAEDGIRDVERSRGLGDVYKRQAFCGTHVSNKRKMILSQIDALLQSIHCFNNDISVSYTHLTLPTILLVQISVVAVSLKKKKKQNIQQIQQKSTDRNTLKRGHRQYHYI
eukprot:TRINITY_DN12549_c0_g1_i4.p1 TRINITY_DN12549_c0_g1~~TRINITY_DN12549_c0_g1_i4.p1  ORF type:complete len:116 (+),score=35.68 TRINITY_DN12549_c0_g1_i4:110-457(+)